MTIQRPHDQNTSDSAKPLRMGWAPIYTTHGHGRKTHITLIDAEGNNGRTLCGTKDRHPDLFWCCGDVTPFSEANNWVGSDADDNGCIICKRKLLAVAATMVK